MYIHLTLPPYRIAALLSMAILALGPTHTTHASDSKGYYNTLGLNTNATLQEIKNAYKKLAKKWHPDRNPGNKQAAEATFKKIGEAYSVLSDPQKKQQYDNGTYRMSGGVNAHDLFNGLFDLFGGGTFTNWTSGTSTTPPFTLQGTPNTTQEDITFKKFSCTIPRKQDIATLTYTIATNASNFVGFRPFQIKAIFYDHQDPTTRKTIKTLTWHENLYCNNHGKLERTYTQNIPYFNNQENIQHATITCIADKSISQSTSHNKLIGLFALLALTYIAYQRTRHNTNKSSTNTSSTSHRRKKKQHRPEDRDQARIPHV